MDVVVTEREGLRLLRFGTHWCQGLMRIADPDRLELEYAVRMCAWLLFHDPDTLPGKHLATLGLGAGSLTKFALNVLGMQATGVEIDARVIAACRASFLLPQDGPRLQVVHDDAGAFLARSPARFDAVQVDAYDASVERPALDTEAFYADCRRSLRPGGTVAVNLVGRDLDVAASVARLRAGLRPRAIWRFPPTEAGNVVVIAHTGDVPDDAVLAARAQRIERSWDLPATEWPGVARRLSV